MHQGFFKVGFDLYDEQDHIPASSVTITSLFMLVFIIFNGRLLSTGTQKPLLNMKLNCYII